MKLNKSILCYFFLALCTQTITYAQDFTVAASYANFLYRGMNNSIHLTVNGYSCDSLIISIDEGTISSQLNSSCYLEIRPSIEKTQYTLSLFLRAIKMKDTVFIGKKTFDVVDIPPIKAGIFYKQSGSLPKEVLLGHVRILLYPPFEFQLSIGIDRFSILVLRNDEIHFIGHFKQAYFDEEIYKMFANLENGDRILFFNLSASNGGKPPIIQIEPIEFIIED